MTLPLTKESCGNDNKRHSKNSNNAIFHKIYKRTSQIDKHIKRIGTITEDLFNKHVETDLQLKEIFTLFHVRYNVFSTASDERVKS